MRNNSENDTEVAAFDPVALTIAVWLGVIVGSTGLVRLAERAADQAAATRTAASIPSPASFSISGGS